MVPAPPIDAARVVADLRELARRTGDDAGAQRLAWTETWRDARLFLSELLAAIDVAHEVDEAGNLWARLEGADESAPALALGSHLDSVPDGGWLDGALGVMGALGAMRSHALAGQPPPIPLVLVDWADEEGARFGRSLFGSSAFAGTLDPAEVAGLHDADGRALPDVLVENGIDLERAGECSRRRNGLGAYLELHIEQGPVLEREGMTVAAVSGCQGIERVRFTFSGQASHAGTTPMELRSDAGLAAAACALEIERLPGRHGGVATTGELRLKPGIATAVAGEATLGCDLRNPDRDALASMLGGAHEAARRCARERGCDVADDPVWRIEPVGFDDALVTKAREACRQATGAEFELTSGALHDAAEVARVMPAAMLFCPSQGGISHTVREDTNESDLVVALETFGDLVAMVLDA